MLFTITAVLAQLVIKTKFQPFSASAAITEVAKFAIRLELS
jgi:hypothetical protein